MYVFVGELRVERRWVQTKVEGWAESVKTLVGVARKHPQSAYAGLQKSLQQEWAFVQRVTPGIGKAFVPVEEDIAKAFFPALFEGAGDGAPGREITRLPVKQAGMALPNPTLTAPENCQASCVITGHLVPALRGQVPFRTADHAAFLRDGRAAVRRQNAAKAVASLETTIARAPAVVTRRLRRATKTGAWLTVQPSTVNGTELGAQEWRDTAFLRYGLEPPDLSKHCDGCNAKFSICHALDCKRGVL